MNNCHFLLSLLLLSAPVARAEGAEVTLLVRNAPHGGVAMGRLTLPAAWCDPRVRADASVEGQRVTVQFVPLDPTGGRDYIVLAKLPAGGTHRVRLKLIRGRADAAPRGKVTVKTPWLVVTHDSARGAGLPGKIEFLQTRKVFENFHWNDRVYHKQLGGYLLRNDRHAEVAVVSSGPICTAVRTAGRYVKADSTAPKSEPRARYLWLYFRDVPLVYVRAEVSQKTAVAWNELHFLELNFADKSFPDWAGAEPLKKGGFAGSQKGVGFGGWGMLLDGRNGIAALGGGKILLYDGRGGYGTYLHAHASSAWAGWRDTKAAFAGWLWIGTDGDCVARVREAVGRLPTQAHLIVTRPKLRDGIEAARKKIGQMPAGDPGRIYNVAMAEKLEAQGKLDLAAQVLAGGVPEKWATVIAGDLALTLVPVKDGVRCGGLFDLGRGRELLSAAAMPLFDCTLRHSRSRKEMRLGADAGWGQLDMRKGAGGELTIRWAKPAAPAELSAMRVTAVARPDAAKSRISWTFRVELGGDTPWSVWRVTFPQISLGPFARRVHALFPRGCGEVAKDVGGRSWRLRGTYPSGWTPMQFLAAYDADAATGLYVAVHDGQGHVKDILAETRAETRAETQALRLSFDHPAPDMGVAGNGFMLSGQAVWQLLRGDWFDAARIYRDWVRKEADWMRRPVDQGRIDSPAWMRELCIWGMLSGDPKRALDHGRKFEQFMGLPTGFHWYSWHKIPFDNDYPHYFPARDGFKDTVAALQKSGTVFVMPYINGRLWDTRDKGATDFEFTRLARGAATKDEHGRVRTEMYGSKESDGSRVKLAAMCPATALWRARVRQIVLRLMKDNGTKAVYIDQIAAAGPRLCFDKSHGHPLGGGGWWVKAYGKMLAEIRKSMPAGHVLTTECNAEPYVKWFDGYLTWHWQYDGQVPAFPAVYGGAIQMFGRAYRAGPTKDLALRMKAGQQLVFGEQIGWISAGVVNERANASFLRQMAWVRWRVRGYFDTGQMARPPKLVGTIPRITADWRWSGVWPVTTDAVLTGAWEQPAGKKVVLIFVNVSDKPVTAQVSFDAASHGLVDTKVRLTRITADGRGRAESARAKFTRKIVFAPEQAWAWEVTAEGD